MRIKGSFFCAKVQFCCASDSLGCFFAGSIGRIRGRACHGRLSISFEMLPGQGALPHANLKMLLSMLLC